MTQNHVIQYTCIYTNGYIILMYIVLHYFFIRYFCHRIYSNSITCTTLYQQGFASSKYKKITTKDTAVYTHPISKSL